MHVWHMCLVTLFRSPEAPHLLWSGGGLAARNVQALDFAGCSQGEGSISTQTPGRLGESSSVGTSTPDP